jgi:hypothetical protein
MAQFLIEEPLKCWNCFSPDIVRTLKWRRSKKSNMSSLLGAKASSEETKA